MGKEIERKFLVTDNSYPKENSIHIRQGFLTTDAERMVRIRIKGDVAFLTIKSGSFNTVRQEFEYPIPLKDAKKLLDTVCIKPIIEKIRYRIQAGNLTWEVDEFRGENKGLVIAEVELESENQEIKIPDWIGEEVTGNPKYYNIYLVENPYNTWKQ